MKIHRYRKSAPSLFAVTLIWKTSVSLSFAVSPISEKDCAKLDSAIQLTSAYFVCWVDSFYVVFQCFWFFHFQRLQNE